MKDYFATNEYILDSLTFDYLGKRFYARGFMSWNPDRGFHLEALLNLERMPEIGKTEFSRTRVIRKSDRASIRMLLKRHGYNWAIAPSIELIDRHDVLSENRLSININRVVFSRYHTIDLTGDKLKGSALLELNEITFLSDKLSSEEVIKVQGEEVLRLTRQSGNGIRYKGEKGQEIIGHSSDGKYLEISWSLPRDNFTKSYSWKLPEAIQNSLSILLGQEVNLLKRSVFCGHQERVEIKKRQPVRKLDLFSLFNNDSSLNKAHFVRLMNFLIEDQPQGDICLNIFRQVLEATKQRNWQVSELLVSTTLEAALRNICDKPFQAKKSKWNVGVGLKYFFNQYLSEEWQGIQDPVMKAHTFLRDRNAHPDWLFKQGGALSEEETEKSLDSLIFLSIFYGYMILAIAGVKDIKPYFPTSHTEWGAAWSLTPARHNETFPEEWFNKIE